MTITVYSKPHCVQCAMTKRKLGAEGAPYTDVDISEDADALEFVKGLGWMEAPVVVVHDDENGRITDHWSGFRPDRIKKAVGR